MKTLNISGKAVILGLAVLLLSLFASGASVQAALVLSDEAGGGGCVLAGTWDSATKTCALTVDLNVPVEIISNGIALDGRGHYLTGNGGGNGITITGLADVMVRDLVIQGFTNGIVLNHTTAAVVHGVTVRGMLWGMWVNDYAQQNVLTGNTLEGNSIGLQITWYARQTFVESNVISSNGTGVNLGYTFGNEFVNNAFIGNGVQFAERGIWTDYLEANYWSDYDTPAEGCIDADANGYCDTPYLLLVSKDLLPATSPEVDTIAPIVSVAVTPAVLTPDLKRNVDVIVTGYAGDTKSGIASLLIELKDEYGVYDQIIPGFGSVVTLKAKTDPKDTDGRTYTITARAVDAKGNEATATTTVFVSK